MIENARELIKVRTDQQRKKKKTGRSMSNIYKQLMTTTQRERQDNKSGSKTQKRENLKQKRKERRESKKRKLDNSRKSTNDRNKKNPAKWKINAKEQPIDTENRIKNIIARTGRNVGRPCAENKEKRTKIATSNKKREKKETKTDEESRKRQNKRREQQRQK